MTRTSQTEQAVQCAGLPHATPPDRSRASGARAFLTTDPSTRGRFTRAVWVALAIVAGLAAVLAAMGDVTARRIHDESLARSVPRVAPPYRVGNATCIVAMPVPPVEDWDILYDLRTADDFDEACRTLNNVPNGNRRLIDSRCDCGDESRYRSGALDVVIQRVAERIVFRFHDVRSLGIDDIDGSLDPSGCGSDYDANWWSRPAFTPDSDSEVEFKVNYCSTKRVVIHVSGIRGTLIVRGAELTGGGHSCKVMHGYLDDGVRVTKVVSHSRRHLFHWPPLGVVYDDCDIHLKLARSQPTTHS